MSGVAIGTIAVGAYSAHRARQQQNALGAAPTGEMDSALKQAYLQEASESRLDRAEARTQQDQMRKLYQPYIAEDLARSSRMAGLAEQQALKRHSYQQNYFDPWREREYAEAFRPETQLEAERARAGSTAQAEVQTQISAMQREAARRAAQYGQFSGSGRRDIQRTVAAGAAKASAGRSAIDQTKRLQIDRKRGAAGLFSDDPDFGGVANISGVGRGISNSTALQTRAGNPMAALNALNQGGQFAANMQSRNYQTGMARADADMAAAGQLVGAGAFDWSRRQSGGGGGGGGAPAWAGDWYADGGEVGEYADDWSDIQFYADGGDVGDDEYAEGEMPMQPALQRHDGALTQGDGSGGKLSGPGTGISDDIPATTDTGEDIRVANGEYIIPTDVVEILGEEFFDNLVARLHTPAAIQREQEGV